MNVLGVLNVCRATVPLLRAAGGGGIVNFSSVDALAVSEGQLVYSASKAAVMRPHPVARGGARPRRSP